MNKTSTNNKSWRPLITLGILALIFLTVVWPGRNAPPFSDDTEAIVYSQEMTARGISPLGSMRFRDSVAYYRPIKNLTFGIISSMSDSQKPESLQAALASARTFGFFYSLVAALGVFSLVRHLSRNEWLAVTASGLWLLSAAGTSAATWVSAQNIGIAVACGCFALIAASRFVTTTRTRSQLSFGTGAVLLFAAALLCYDSLVALPGILAAMVALPWLQIRPDRREACRAAMLLFLFTAIVGGWLYVRHQTGAISDGSKNSVLFSPDTTRAHLFTASAWFFWRHALMWVWPFGTLEIGGTYIPGVSASTPSLIWGWAFLIAYLVTIPVLAWRSVRHRCRLTGLIALGLAMGLIGAFPSGNFVPLYSGPMGDYYTVLPSVGWSLALASAIFLLMRQARKLREPDARRVIPAVAAASLALICVNRAAGVVTMDTISRRSMNVAEMALASIGARPNMAINQVHLAAALVAEGQVELAIPIYESAIEIAPWATRIGYAQALSQVGRYEEAIAQYNKALKTEKERDRLLTANYSKAVALRKIGRLDEAKAVVQSVIHNADYRHHVQLVAFGIVVAHEAGDDETARRWLAKARELYPGNPLIDQAAAAAGLR